MPPPPEPLADLPVDVTLSAPELLGRGFRIYERYRYILPGDDPHKDARTHDLVRFGHIVAVLPVDIARDEVVLIRQFRLPAQLANGKGELVEIVAGHVEKGEQLPEAARRECLEEIGVAPRALRELFTYLPTPGASDEEITLFLGIVDATQVPDRAGAAAEREETRPMRVSIDEAVTGLAAGAMRNGLLVIALQWLALNRERLRKLAAG
ncbi:MAG TPA: NUDIX domain-containing protein [Xanthobacteraceae bacterium]|nr:NUDIX domain-containing protein [Xanthobacteraceae bacterium]